MWVNLWLVPIVIRICLVVLFPFSALDKIVFWKDALKQADSSSIPKAFGPSLLVLAVIVELAAPVLIVIGWHDRIAALILAAFCVVTAFLYHPFWKFSDFWKPTGSVARGHFWDFLKNFGLVGGLLLIVFATRLMPMSGLQHPLSSTPVYTPQGTADMVRAPARDRGRP